MNDPESKQIYMQTNYFWMTNVCIHRFQGIFDANVFSELAVLTESKMIIFMSGPLQGFTFSGKFCTQSATRRPPKLRFCLDAFVLKVTCD